MPNKGFTHLHLHSQYSLLDGAIAFDNLFKRCKELQMDSAAAARANRATIRRYCCSGLA